MSNLNGTPVPLRLLDHKGEEVEFRCSPLTAKDSDELTRWVQDRAMAIAKRACQGEDEVSTQRILRMGMTEAMKMDWRMGQGAVMMATPEGMSKLVHLSVLSNHPEVSLDDMKEFIFNPKQQDKAATDRVRRNLNEANTKVGRVNGFVTTEDLPGKRKKGKKRKRKRKAKQS